MSGKHNVDIKNLNLWSWQSTSKKIDYNGRRCENEIVVNGFVCIVRCETVCKRNGQQASDDFRQHRVDFVNQCAMCIVQLWALNVGRTAWWAVVHDHIGAKWLNEVI